MSLTVITLNCHGLGSVDKFRLVLNKANEYVNKGNTIILLQETMITNENYLKLAWRGKSVFTPGTGNSQGCITLTNSDANIEHIYHLGNRGHYFIYSSLMTDVTVIMNIYAPTGSTGSNDVKTEFFNDAFNTLGNYDCDIIMGGDMNVTLCHADRHRRGVMPAEEQLAEMIKEFVELLHLNDVWQDKKGYTWRKEQKMSK